MTSSERKIKLNLFILGAGHHVAAWRHPEARTSELFDIAFYQSLAETAERGLFDALFIADSVGLLSERPASLRGTPGAAHLEPYTLLSALSVTTRHLGLIGTGTTTYNEPFHLARKLASLDHLSRGRAGWNLVTSITDREANNFGRDRHVDHELRYARAQEFFDVALGLWDSWGDNALVADKAQGICYDSATLRELNHVGEHFRVRGPLTVLRPVQGYPVIVQAGASPSGRETAARNAEVVFTAQPTLAEAQTFYRDLKGRMPRYGRRADDLKIMPGLIPIVGETEADARAKFDALQALIDPAVAIALLENLLGDIDLSGLPADGPLPADIVETNRARGRQRLLIDMAARESLSIREMALRAARSRGHQFVIGTASTIADQLEHWFRNGAADGFNVMPHLMHSGLEDFVRLVVPELQARGLFRVAYEGSTLRENLGLPRPSRHAWQGRARASAT